LTPCKETLWSLDSHGYGHVWRNGKLCLHHRVVWEMLKSPIPEGMCVLHKCDNRKCINIEHLFLGTKRDNTIDMYRKGRGPNNKGTANGRAKLTKRQVQAIRRSKASNKDLAEKYDVKPVTVWRVRKGISH
jgi:hypothetical protein